MPQWAPWPHEPKEAEKQVFFYLGIITGALSYHLSQERQTLYLVELSKDILRWDTIALFYQDNTAAEIPEHNRIGVPGG